MFPKPKPAKKTKKAIGNCRKPGNFFHRLTFLLFPVFTSPEDARLMHRKPIPLSFLAPCFPPRQCSIPRRRHWETISG